jgi:hypothetical protein
LSDPTRGDAEHLGDLCLREACSSKLGDRFPPEASEIRQEGLLFGHKATHGLGSLTGIWNVEKVLDCPGAHLPPSCFACGVLLLIVLFCIVTIAPLLPRNVTDAIVPL